MCVWVTWSSWLLSKAHFQSHQNIGLTIDEYRACYVYDLYYSSTSCVRKYSLLRAWWLLKCGTPRSHPITKIQQICEKKSLAIATTKC